jgi:hypothetical protein
MGLLLVMVAVQMFMPSERPSGDRSVRSQVKNDDIRFSGPTMPL